MAEGMSDVLLYVARVLRDQLEDLLSGLAEAPGLRTTLNLAAKRILVSQGALQTLGRRESMRVAANALMLPPGHSQNEDLMNANVWNALPPQLLHLVFAHLPVPEIQRLRFLSKDWKQSLETPISEFRRVCAAEECSSKFAVLCSGCRDGKFSVNTFDLRTTQWQAFEYQAPSHRLMVVICACDGGLVCFVYEVWTAMQGGPLKMCMSVWNPVTGGEVQLPPLPVSDFSQCAAKLYVDLQTKSFKVLLITIVKSIHGDKISAHVFDSVAWKWDAAEKSSTSILWSSRCCMGRISLSQLNDSMTWRTAFPILAGFCSYNSAAGILKRQSWVYDKLNGICVKTVACTEDKCFFLLQNAQASEYEISEYHNGGEKYNKSYRCPPLAKFPQGACEVELQACKNFLILDAHTHQQERRWLLDLSTGKWRDLPVLPGGKTFSHVLCELQWNVCPQSSNRK